MFFDMFFMSIQIINLKHTKHSLAAGALGTGFIIYIKRDFSHPTPTTKSHRGGGGHPLLPPHLTGVASIVGGAASVVGSATAAVATRLSISDPHTSTE